MRRVWCLLRLLVVGLKGDIELEVAVGDAGIQLPSYAECIYCCLFSSLGRYDWGSQLAHPTHSIMEYGPIKNGMEYASEFSWIMFFRRRTKDISFAQGW